AGPRESFAGRGGDAATRGGCAAPAVGGVNLQPRLCPRVSGDAPTGAGVDRRGVAPAARPQRKRTKGFPFRGPARGPPLSGTDQQVTIRPPCVRPRRRSGGGRPAFVAPHASTCSA